MPDKGQQHLAEKSRKLQCKLYLAAKKDKQRRFHALYDRIFRLDILWRAWKEVKANKGSAGIDGIMSENAKSRAEEICKILDTYIPSMEKMDTLLRKYCVAFTKTASENKKLKTKNAELEESLASVQKVSTLKQIEDLKLRHDYDSAVAILEQIPAEVLNIYAQSSHRGKERPIEQSL